MADDSESPIHAPTSTSDVAARLQNLRNLLTSERHLGAEQRRAIEALDQEMDDMTAEQHRASMERVYARTERRRPYADAILREGRDPSQVAPPLPTSTSPSALVRTRRRAFRPSDRLSRGQRERLGQGGSQLPSPSYITPPPRLSPPLPNPGTAVQEYVGEASLDREYGSRAKRRKLDDGTFEDESKVFSYGHKGQVVPGQLRLEIVSCDGGEYADPHVSVNSWPQNALQDDSTVYCTKSNRCNMLLKHVGGMPFTLTKIIVKAPRSGYDAPIQEGMIFVAMSDDNILEKTSQYEIHYSPKSYRYHRQRYIESYRPSQEYLHPTRSPLRSIDRSRYLRDPDPVATHLTRQEALNTSVVPGFAVSTGDPSDTEETRDVSLSPRPWHDSDAEYSLRSYTDRYRPHPELPLPGRNDEASGTSSESEDGDVPNAPDERAQEYAMFDALSRRHRFMDRMRLQQMRDAVEFPPLHREPSGEPEDEAYVNRRSTPNRIGVRSFAPAIGAPDPANPTSYERLNSDVETASSSKSTAEATTATISGLPDTIAPHARFFIQRQRSSIAVKFDPPVAGRYILIKLWASCPNANIDIQSITAHGYGGPRFFPGVETR